MQGRQGDSVAAALLAAGVRTLRRGPEDEARGLFCGIGVCFECLVTIDGRGGQRACLASIREGMNVRSLKP